MASNRRAVLLILAVAACGAGASGKRPVRQKDGVRMTDPKVFESVPLNTFSRTRCSPPEPDITWRGVAIQAPQRVGFQRGVRIGPTKAFAAIPVCGVYVLQVPFPVVADTIQLVAKDKRTGRTYSGPVRSLDSSPDKPHPNRKPLRKEDVEGLAAGRYFNPNLADVAGLPDTPGVYDVYAEVRGVRSNVVTIEVLEGGAK
jgi:hypothetical protein